MLTLQTLTDEQLLAPARPELVNAPPRIAAPDARTRAVLGYLSANCGGCHNEESSLASLGLLLKARLEPSHTSHARSGAGAVPADVEVADSSGARRRERVRHAGRADLSALLVRMRSRRPSTQMPPLGTVLHDREAIDLVTGWIQDLARR